MPKRILEGAVVSDKGDKTVIVLIERTFQHPVLKKPVRRTKRYHAHDEGNVFHTGRQGPDPRVRAQVEAEDVGGPAQGGRLPGLGLTPDLEGMIL